MPVPAAASLSYRSRVSIITTPGFTRAMMPSSVLATWAGRAAGNGTRPLLCPEVPEPLDDGAPSTRMRPVASAVAGTAARTRAATRW